MVKVNGQVIEDADGMVLIDLLKCKGYDLTRIAVECNGNIIPKAQYSHKILENGDSFEIVGFVGGG
ncbi:MAG TPA: thiamine biosynthesis protein ThiS [Syntrophomonas sp.]|nr:thiamine biosynthesis protein ThiS [Syntrophomonas sp.]